jgi:hypothetical protein
VKFGILINSYKVQEWQRSVILRLLQEGHECKFVVLNDNPPVSQGIVKRLRRYPYKLLLYRLYWRFLMKIPSLGLVSIGDLIQGAEEIRCKTISEGFAMHFHEDDLTRIGSFQADFILRFGFSIIKGGILQAAKYGVWSYHHDDPERYRGVPTGFHEIIHNDPVNGAILQRLGDKIDGGEVLYKGYFGTRFHSWKGNLEHLLSSTTEWPALVCRRINSEGFTAVKDKTEAPGKLFKLPHNLLMIRFLALLFRNRIRFHLQALLQHELWFTVVNRNISDTLIQSGEISLPEPELLLKGTSPGTYQADPFGLLLDDGILMLTEDYCYRRKKGIIVSHVYDKDFNHRVRFTVALEVEGHLAYPFLFQHKGHIYCLPENAEGGHVDLYRYDRETDVLVFHRRLIPNLAAIDGTLLFHEEKWYYFFTDRQSTNERLHIWHADDLEGPYQPHLLNPVKMDIRSARPAGRPFRHQGRLFRPSQDCSLRSGWRVNIQEIVTLSPTLFHEKGYAVVTPPATLQRKRIKGTHTFSLSHGLLVADIKEEVFILSAFSNSIQQRLKRLFKRLR